MGVFYFVVTISISSPKGTELLSKSSEWRSKLWYLLTPYHTNGMPKNDRNDGFFKAMQADASIVSLTPPSGMSPYSFIKCPHNDNVCMETSLWQSSYFDTVSYYIVFMLADVLYIHLFTGCHHLMTPNHFEIFSVYWPPHRAGENDWKSYNITFFGN